MRFAPNYFDYIRMGVGKLLIHVYYGGYSVIACYLDYHLLSFCYTIGSSWSKWSLIEWPSDLLSISFHYAWT